MGHNYHQICDLTRTQGKAGNIYSIIETIVTIYLQITTKFTRLTHVIDIPSIQLAVNNRKKVTSFVALTIILRQTRDVTKHISFQDNAMCFSCAKKDKKVSNLV